MKTTVSLALLHIVAGILILFTSGQVQFNQPVNNQPVNKVIADPNAPPPALGNNNKVNNPVVVPPAQAQWPVAQPQANNVPGLSLNVLGMGLVAVGFTCLLGLLLGWATGKYGIILAFIGGVVFVLMATLNGNLNMAVEGRSFTIPVLPIASLSVVYLMLGVAVAWKRTVVEHKYEPQIETSVELKPEDHLAIAKELYRLLKTHVEPKKKKGDAS